MIVTYEYPRPALAVHCVVFGMDADELKILLIRRECEPYLGAWALPGGFVQMDESLQDAALRKLQEETGLERVFIEQFHTFGDVDRDPRGRVVSVAHYALVKLSDPRVRAATDANEAGWFSLRDLPPLAFDHQSMVDAALTQLRDKIRYQAVGFELLPAKFTLTSLQRLYEKILERPIDKRNFRKKILAMEFLVELDEIEQDVAHRAARLYRFDRKKYQQFEKNF